MQVLGQHDIIFLKMLKAKEIYFAYAKKKLPDLGDLEQKTNDPEKNGFVPIEMRQIKATFLKNGINDIKRLKQMQVLDFCEKVNDKGYKQYFYKSLIEIAPDFSLLPSGGILKTPLHKIMIENLKHCSIEGDSTPYFECFLDCNNPEYFFKVDTFAGRVHTPITSLKRELRSKLLIQGEPVSKLDVEQMQPMLLSEILSQHIGSNKFTTHLSNGGDIYELIKEKLTLPSRDKAKEKFYEITFGKPSESLQNVFGNESWIQWINTIKNITISENERAKIKGNYNNIAWLLQNSEVNIMQKVWANLAKNDIIFLTVHDEVIVKQSDQSKAATIFRKVLSKYMPFAKIKITPEPPKWITIHKTHTPLVTTPPPSKEDNSLISYFEALNISTIKTPLQVKKGETINDLQKFITIQVIRFKQGKTKEQRQLPYERLAILKQTIQELKPTI